jgi:predicted AlkP superfamily pyrophosphatase or phosphodiesterase
MRRPVLFLALALVAFVVAARAQTSDHITILISIDGWRWDYIDRAEAPNLKALAARGVRAKELIPSFPPLTFPNHYTIVTGLYPGHHGIVQNTMYDPATRLRFSLTSP